MATTPRPKPLTAEELAARKIRAAEREAYRTVDRGARKQARIQENKAERAATRADQSNRIKTGLDRNGNELGDWEHKARRIVEPGRDATQRGKRLAAEAGTSLKALGKDEFKSTSKFAGRAANATGRGLLYVGASAGLYAGRGLDSGIKAINNNIVARIPVVGGVAAGIIDLTRSVVKGILKAPIFALKIGMMIAGKEKLYNDVGDKIKDPWQRLVDGANRRRDLRNDALGILNIVPGQSQQQTQQQAWGPTTYTQPTAPMPPKPGFTPQTQTPFVNVAPQTPAPKQYAKDPNLDLRLEELPKQVVDKLKQMDRQHAQAQQQHGMSDKAINGQKDHTGRLVDGIQSDTDTQTMSTNDLKQRGLATWEKIQTEVKRDLGNRSDATLNATFGTDIGAALKGIGSRSELSPEQRNMFGALEKFGDRMKQGHLPNMDATAAASVAVVREGLGTGPLSADQAKTLSAYGVAQQGVGRLSVSTNTDLGAAAASVAARDYATPAPQPPTPARTQSVGAEL